MTLKLYPIIIIKKSKKQLIKQSNNPFKLVCWLVPSNDSSPRIKESVKHGKINPKLIEDVKNQKSFK